MELGIYTFGEVTHDPATGRQLDAGDRLRQLAPQVRAEIARRKTAAAEHASGAAPQ